MVHTKTSPNSKPVSLIISLVIFVTCGTKAEVNSWLEALKNYVVHTQTSPSSKPVILIISFVIFPNTLKAVLLIQSHEN